MIISLFRLPLFIYILSVKVEEPGRNLTAADMKWWYFIICCCQICWIIWDLTGKRKMECLNINFSISLKKKLFYFWKHKQTWHFFSYLNVYLLYTHYLSSDYLSSTLFKFNIRNACLRYLRSYNIKVGTYKPSKPKWLNNQNYQNIL